MLRVTDPDLSETIAQVRKSKERLSNTTVITACPSCREQFLGNNIETVDIVELLAQALNEGGDKP